MVALDCGSGSGYMALELARRGARVLACDLTPAGLYRLARIAAAEGLAGRILPICCTAEALPVRASSVDAFIANGLLEHLPDEVAAADEWARVCTTASTLMVTVPVRFSLVHPLLVAVQWWRDRQVGHLHRYDLNTLRRVLTGWSLHRAIYTGHWSKAWRVLANFTRLVRFEEEALERMDAAHEAHARRSSNLISFWRRDVPR
jgi:ubiquinone/menaquinone biosynthesis C-methylase UbiE